MLAVPAMAKIKLDSGMANAFSLFSLSFLPNSVIRPVLYLGALLVAWMLIGSMDAEIAMWIHFVALVVVAVPLSVYFHRSTRGRVEGTQPVYETSVWNRTSASLILLSLFTNYLPDIMVITSGFFVPSAELGIFNAALRLAILTKFGLFAVDAFVAPAITAHQRKNEREDLIRVMRHSTRLRLLAALIPLVIFALAGKFILGLFGEEFRDGYTILLILSASYLVVGAVGPAGRLLSVSGFHIQALKASQLALILWIVIAPLMLWQFGAIGGAVAGLITLAMWSFALWSYVRRYFSINTLSLLIN
jgi:O-antigen/teichoic acid export membrane protein